MLNILQLVQMKGQSLNVRTVCSVRLLLAPARTMFICSASPDGLRGGVHTQRGPFALTAVAQADFERVLD